MSIHSILHIADLASAPSDLVLLEDGGALAALTTGGLVRMRPDGTVGPRIELREPMPIVSLPDGSVFGVSSGRLIEVDPDEHSPLGHELRVGGRPLSGLLAGNPDHLLVRDPDATLVLVDTATLAIVGPPLDTSMPVDAITGASISADSTQLAIATPFGVEVLEVALGRARLPPFPIGSGNAPTFSPDGRRLLIGGFDGTTSVVDVTSGATLWTRQLASAPVVGTVWSDTGELVAARRMGQETTILDAATGTDVSGPYPDLMSLTFATGGDTALTAGTELRIIDARRGTVLRTFDGIGGLFWAGFVRGGRWVNALTGSGLVELVDVDTGTRLGVPLRVIRDALSESAVGVPTGNGIYFGPLEGPVVHYDLDPSAWVDDACAAAGRNLTRAEWDRYLRSLGEYRSTCPEYPAGT